MTESQPPATGSPAEPSATLSRPTAILDPSACPVTRSDADLPPVPPERLQPAWLRQHLAARAHTTPFLQGDGPRPDFMPDRSPAAASVLVPLVQRPDGLQVLLTRRTAHLRSHAGQISFPGGRQEPGDADVVATALREAQEEIGLLANELEVIARLPVYATVTRFQVTPVVALVSPDHTLQLDAFEVAAAFEVPLAFLMTPAHHQHHSFDNGGLQRQFLSMPWQSPGGEEYFIWGATAAMLRNLYHLLVV
ncbi:CoA pyrophosphatase [Ideonella azotifigens]|uniref:CoA pyrophosphatase n=1 Tax=Ideonella azotifigens TaxID=513160 RepID=A0ABP3V7C1_9BURK